MYAIRKAIPEDIPFLIDCILAAESFGGKSTYEILFDLSYPEARDLLHRIFLEEIDNQEVSVNSFAVVTYGDQKVAGCAAWIEAIEDLSSSTLKATALSYLLPHKFQDNPKLQALSEVNIPRTPHTIQLESFYTVPAFRGKGLAQCLIDFHLYHLKSPQVTSAEIITVSENLQAIQAYQKAQFYVSVKTTSENPLVSAVIGGKGKTLLKRKL